jgi:urea transport system ATP-binding protein
MGGVALLVDSVTVEFGSFRAVDKLSLAIDFGEVRAVIGPNDAARCDLRYHASDAGPGGLR